MDDLYEEIDVERQTVNNFIDKSNDYDSNYDVESEDEMEEQDEGNLGDTIMELWKKRKTKLVHDYSLTGWIMSPIPMVYADVNNCKQYEARMAMRRVFKQLFFADAADNCTEYMSALDTLHEEL